MKEMQAKMERLEQELREKTQESKIASSKIRELQSSGDGLPVKKIREPLKPLEHKPGDKSQRLPSVGRTGTSERMGGRNSSVAVRTVPQSPAKSSEKAGTKSALDNTKKSDSGLQR